MFDSLPAYLSEHLGLACDDLQIKAFPGGFSNLTYAISCDAFSYVLRRPPLGNKISKAHDMVREFKVLKALKKAGYTKMPRPILLCEDESIIGAPFFLMEQVIQHIVIFPILSVSLSHSLNLCCLHRMLVMEVQAHIL